MNHLFQIIVFTIGVLAATISYADIISVDIGVEDKAGFTSFTPNDIQAGFENFAYDPAFNGNAS